MESLSTSCCTGSEVCDDVEFATGNLYAAVAAAQAYMRNITQAPNQPQAKSASDVDSDITSAKTHMTNMVNASKAGQLITMGNEANLAMSYLNAGMMYRSKTQDQVWQMQTINNTIYDTLANGIVSKSTVYGFGYSATKQAVQATTQTLPLPPTTTTTQFLPQKATQVQTTTRQLTPRK
jgi:hypothetical protein